MAQALTRGHYAYSLSLARLKHVRPELSHLVNQARPGQAKLSIACSVFFYCLGKSITKLKHHLFRLRQDWTGIYRGPSFGPASLNPSLTQILDPGPAWVLKHEAQTRTKAC